MTDTNVDSKTWKLLEKAVLSSVTEQRRTRRWGICLVPWHCFHR